MSYSIIFQTKIIKLDDGRIIHLSRNGCNNDTAGREKGVYDGKLYTTKEFEDFIKKFDVDSEGWDLKIGSKYVTYKDYAAHLRRMHKRATTWNKLKEIANANFKHIPYVRYLVGVDVRKAEDGTTQHFTPREWDKVCYDYWIGFRTTYHYEFAYELDEIIPMLETKDYVEFHIA